MVALNEYADEVRKEINPDYFKLQGKFVIRDVLGVLGDPFTSKVFLPDKYVSED